jgi:hypothetical protein
MYDPYKTPHQNDHPNDRSIQNTQPLLGSVTSRRAFLKRIAMFGAAGASLPLLTACGAGSSRTAGQSPGEDTQNTGIACSESADLSRMVVAARNAVAYVDESPYADKLCSNCRFFKEPDGNAGCGTCEIIGGPIAPDGYCNAWVAE